MSKFFLPVVRDSISGWQMGLIPNQVGAPDIYGPFDNVEEIRKAFPKTKGIMLEGQFVDTQAKAV